jgi:uncharacterized protein (DUF58 family)
MTTERPRGTWSDRLPALRPRFVCLVAAAAVLVALVPIGWPWNLVAVNAGLVALALLDWLLTVRPTAVDVQRVVPEAVRLEEQAEISWRITNSSKRGALVSVADELPPSLQAATKGGTAWVERSGSVVLQTTALPQRRGRLQLPALTVRVVGPLGLVAREERRHVSGTVRAYPMFPAQREAELRLERGRILEVGLRSVRAHGGGTEFEQLREYGVDDDYRRIDWSATARMRKPIVRTFRAEQHQRVVILVDCGRTMAAKVAGVPRLDHAMDAAMGLATVASHVGDEVGLVSFDAEIRSRTPAQPGRRQVAALTEAVYDLQPRLIESSYSSVFSHVLENHRRRSLVVLLTDLAEEVVVDTLVPAVGLILQRHELIVAGVDDPAVRRWRLAEPDDERSAYRKAAASMAIADRRHAIEALRSRGATVVDALPGRLGAELTDAYLQLKATGSL